MVQVPNHQYWMSQALQLAANGFYSTDPNPRVGCVVVKNQILLAEGWHEFSGGPHAEINAINSAPIADASNFYVTLEPCSHQGRTGPCVDELIKFKPELVVIAMQDPNPAVAGKGIAKLEAAGIKVICGVLEHEARALNPGFICRMEKARPFVRLKMAISLDGRTALKNGRSQWISGETARRDVQYLRARSSAILTSSNTIIDDDPSLDLRLSKKELGQNTNVRQPARVIVDSHLRLSGNEKIFQSGGEIWIYTLNHNKKNIERLSAAGAIVTVLENQASKHIDLIELLSHLADREVNELHTECGQTLAGVLIQKELVDELVVYMAPKIMGNQARGCFELGEIMQMNDCVNCSIEVIRKIGDDLRLTLLLNSRGR